MNKLHNIMTGRVESDSFYPEIIRRLTYVIEDVLYPDLSQSLENMMRPKYSPLEKVQGILVADGNIILEPLKRQWDDAIEDEDDSEMELEYKSVLPPATRRPAGRPKKRRNTCSRCGGLGHHKSTCREAVKIRYMDP